MLKVMGESNTPVNNIVPKVKFESHQFSFNKVPHPKIRPQNIARIANAVQCHNLLSDYKDCHEFRFSIVRIVISVTNPRIVFVAVVVSQKSENL